jgi:hypothetical protein
MYIPLLFLATLVEIVYRNVTTFWRIFVHFFICFVVFQIIEFVIIVFGNFTIVQNFTSKNGF